MIASEFRQLTGQEFREFQHLRWMSLSRPFAKSASGIIAVKVINHDGDEVLKVYSADEKKRK